MKQALIQRIRQDLATIAKQQMLEKDPVFMKNKSTLKTYQKEQLMQTHALLLSNRDTRSAALFFLNDIYGSNQMGDRHKDLEKIIPTMEKLFPEPALQVIADAISLNALTEELDNKMVSILGATFNASQYNDAFKSVASKEQREYQVMLVQKVGNALADLVKLPLISTTLKMMTLPAKIGGLSDMHEFLSKGFQTFKTVPNPKGFINTITSKELEQLKEIYESKNTTNLKQF